MHLQLMKPDETGMRFFEFRAILVDDRARRGGRSGREGGPETRLRNQRCRPSPTTALADSASLSQAACWPPLVCRCDDLTRSLCTLLGPLLSRAADDLCCRAAHWAKLAGKKAVARVARCGCSHLACPLHRSSRRIESFVEKREASARHAFAAPICCS